MKQGSTSRNDEVEYEGVRALIEEAKQAERERRWADAAGRYESLVRNPFADDQTRLSALRWLGRVYLEQGNRGAAMDVLEAAVAAATQAGSQSAIAQALNVVAIVHQTGGDLDRAESMYTEARITAQSLIMPRPRAPFTLQQFSSGAPSRAWNTMSCALALRTPSIGVL